MTCITCDMTGVTRQHQHSEAHLTRMTMSSTPSPASGSGRQRTVASSEAAANIFMISVFMFLSSQCLCWFSVLWTRPDEATKETKYKVLRSHGGSSFTGLAGCVGGDHTGETGHNHCQPLIGFNSLRRFSSLFANMLCMYNVYFYSTLFTREIHMDSILIRCHSLCSGVK